jgi:Holliday junction resolvase RusA-like endonuclease
MPVGNKNHICVSGNKRFIKKTAEAERWIRQARLEFVQNVELEDNLVSMKRAQKAIADYCSWDMDKFGVALTVFFIFSEKKGQFKRADIDNLLKGVLDALKINRAGVGLIKDDRYVTMLMACKTSGDRRVDGIYIEIEGVKGSFLAKGE